jgi:hypothetical protein
VQSAALADMAVENIPLMILMHLCWSLWAYSFSHVAVPPLFDLSFVLQYTVVPVTKVLGLSDGVDTIVTRVTQVWLAGCHLAVQVMPLE